MLYVIAFSGRRVVRSWPSEKITFQDHILPLLENKCLNCHNPDEAKGGLDLSTYGAAMTGGSAAKWHSRRIRSGPASTP